MSEFLTEKTLKLFIDESKGYIENLSKDLIDIEEKKADKSTLDRVSRAVHTLKGSSGLLGFTTISNISHKIEDLLQKVKATFPDFESKHLDNIFILIETIDRLLDEITQGNFTNAQEGSIPEINNGNSKTESKPIDKNEKSTPNEPKDATLKRISLLEIIRGVEDDLIPRTKNMLQAVENMILSFEDNPQDEDLLIRISDAASYLYRVFSSTGLSYPISLLFFMKELMGSLKTKENKATKEIIDLLFKTITSIKAIIDDYNKPIDIPLKEIIEEYEKYLQKPSFDKSVITFEDANEVFKRLTVSDKFKDYFEPFERWRICREKLEGKNVFEINTKLNLIKEKLDVNLIEFIKPFGERILVSMVFENLNLKKEVNLLIYVISESYDELNESFDFLKEVGVVSILQIGIETALVEPKKEEKKVEIKQTTSITKDKLLKQTIRVDADKLDNLMNLIAELVIIKNRLSQDVKKLKENISFLEPLSESIQKLIKESQMYIDSDLHIANFTYQELTKTKSYLIALKEVYKKLIRDFSQTDFNIGRISDELQDETMKARMIPISQVFGKFPRKVRDIAKPLNKKIDFIMEGEETKLDKTLVEELEEPILHLVRNSIDHGIEPPEERIKKGKNEIGTIKLRAYYEGNSVVIRVDDDGKGINIEKIKATALKKGIISQKDLEVMEDSQIRNLIFTPNFSTADKVTELSGRGVGMDIVKAKIGELKGIIDVISEPDVGTTFKLKLPITISIIQALVVLCNNFKYVIPIDPIIESLIVLEDQIYTVEGKEVIQYSGSILPIIRLRKVFYEDIDYISQEKCAILVLGVGNKKFGLVVDELIEKQQVVIKSLGELLKNIKYISGATIFGDGSIALIVDVGSISMDISILSKIDLSRKKEKRKIILVVDDSIASCRYHKNILQKAGYRVHTAASAIEAIGKIKTLNYDLIITDVQMPKIDGYTFASKIRSMDEYKKVPIIMVTSDKERADKSRGFQIGVNEYLIKPYSDDELTRTLKKYL